MRKKDSRCRWCASGGGGVFEYISYGMMEYTSLRNISHPMCCFYLCLLACFYITLFFDVVGAVLQN
jgi:hypothetical protein